MEHLENKSAVYVYLHNVIKASTQFLKFMVSVLTGRAKFKTTAQWYSYNNHTSKMCWKSLSFSK
jgi:hypothetical protein